MFSDPPPRRGHFHFFSFGCNSARADYHRTRFMDLAQQAKGEVPMKKSRVSASLCTGFAVLIGLQLVQPLYAQEAPTNHEKLVKHYLIPAEDEPKISQER